MRVNPGDFEVRYRDAHDGDPWAFRSSGYEQRRYRLAVGCLDRPRYRRAFEPGCSVGELTVRLAVRCDEVVALDPSPTALAAAQERAGDAPGVSFFLGAVPEAWPPGGFDLVVLSEIGYYFDRRELAALAAQALAALEPGGQLLAVHWRGRSPDHLLHGDEVHDVLATAVGAPPAVQLLDPGFRCERWDLP